MERSQLQQQIEKGFVQAGIYRVRWYRAGHGPASLVLLHGAGLDSAMLSWAEVLGTFGADWDKELTVYALDLPGYGESTRPGPAAGPGFYPHLCETVHDAAARLGLQRYALAGLSMGGAVAIGCALRWPGSLTALLPVDSWGLAHRLPCHRLCWWYMTRTNWTMAGFRLYASSRRLTRWAIESSLIGDKKAVTEEMVDAVWAACRAPDAGRAMQDFQRSSVTVSGVVPDYTARLPRLTMPVLFFNGDRDALVPEKQTRAAAAQVPGARVEILRGCRHWAPKQCPEIFCRLAAEFVQQANAAPAAE